jgi:Ca2+/Na+ antiporter
MNRKILLYILAIIFMITTFFIVPGELEVIHYLLWFVGIAFFIRSIRKELDKGKDTETSKSI